MHPAAAFVLGFGIGSWCNKNGCELIVRVLAGGSWIHPDA